MLTEAKTEKPVLYNVCVNSKETQMRRFKINANGKDVFADNPGWAVVDTWTGKRTGNYDTARDAAKQADNLERKAGGAK